jgi:hypothetical protein
MSKLEERAIQLINEKHYDEAIKILRRLVSSTEERLQKGKETGVDSWPYHTLASLYRKQKKPDLEIEVLQRFVQNPPMPGATHERMNKEARMRLERHRLFGSEGKGACQVCGKKSVLEQNEIEEWVCSKCNKERKREIRKRQGIQQLRTMGLMLPDTAPEEHVFTALELHGNVTRYVGDVWFRLSGKSYKSAVANKETTTQMGLSLTVTSTSELPAFDRFVSSLFKDLGFAKRLAAKELERTALAEQQLSEEERTDPYKYLHIVRKKPDISKDADYPLVVAMLRARYAEYLPG